MTLPIVYETPQQSQSRMALLGLCQQFEMASQALSALNQQVGQFDAEYRRRFIDMLDAIDALRAELGLDDGEADSDTDVKKSANQLTDTEMAKLKHYYRQAAKLCHPDYLPKSRVKRGIQIFDALNKAYRQYDILSVEAWFLALESGEAFESIPLFAYPARLLSQKQALIRHQITQYQEQIANLKRMNDALIFDSAQWNSLLYDYQLLLENELAELKHRLSEHA